MKLESVREVKKQFVGSYVAPVASGLSIFPPSVALGVSKKGREHVLAVRVFGLNPPFYVDVLEKLTKICRGEMEVQFSVMPSAGLPPTTQNNQEWRHSRLRPIRVGISCGHYRITAGTINSFVRRGNDTFLLSNNHVIANCDDCNIGDAVLQNGVYDGGHLGPDTVARLSQFVELKNTGNRVDAAIAKLADGIEFDPYEIPEVGKMGEPFDGEVEVGDIIHKFGRTTGKTTGRVSAVEVDGVAVNYGERGVLSFDNQIEIVSPDDNGSVSAPGDSGSLFVADGSNSPVGILFAGSFTHTFAGYISEALKLLDVEVIC